MNRPFQYDSLGSRQIRLLHLEPSEDVSAPLKGKVVHAELTESIVYEALSYTWGSLDKTNNINMPQSQLIPLTANLSSALRHLRKARDTRIIWIDQICINQKDLPERHTQVALMTEIYKKAANVTIWIGEADEESDMALSFLPVLLEKVRKFTPDSSYPPQNPMQTLGLMVLGSPAWIAISNLFGRPYFRRVWIVQEVVLGRDNGLRVRCGDWEGEWEDLALASRQFEFNTQNIDNAHDAVAGINALRLSMRIGAKRMRLLDLLFKSYFLRCGDPRDKIFGIMGLAHDNIIQPDYASPVEKVYTGAAQQLIDRQGNLELLSSVVHPRSLTLPSWVPDWSSTIKIRDRLPPVDEGSVPDTIKSEIQESLLYSFSPDGLILTVAHKRIGTIQTTTDAMKPIEFADVLPSWEQLVKQRDPSSALDEKEAYWKALLAVDDPNYTSRSAQIGKRCYEAWKNVLDTRYTNSSGVKSLDETGDMSLEELNDRSITFQNLMETRCIGRKLMLADGYLVLGPSTAEVGDTVCWIHGTQTPMVVRLDVSNDANAQLVGACYVQGHMHVPDGIWNIDERRLELV